MQAGARNSIIACTGFGKTRIGLNAASLLLKKKKDARILIVVPTQVLKDQWQEQLNERHLYQCTVEIINTVITHNYDVDLLIIDEYLSI